MAFHDVYGPTTNPCSEGQGGGCPWASASAGSVVLLETDERDSPSGRPDGITESSAVQKADVTMTSYHRVASVLITVVAEHTDR